MTQTLSTAVALADEATKPATSNAKRFAKMAGAAALSFGMMGTFALPAYAAAPDVEGQPDGFANVQNLQTSDAELATLALDAPTGQVDSEVLEAERKAEEAEKAAALAKEKESATGTKADAGVDIPAGAGGAGIAAAALSQLGVMQDCTALVENSLRAAGIPAGDLGTSVGEYTGLGGTLVSGGDYAPGDILIWPGAHVAVYVGNGQVVHGGWNGNQTVVAGVVTSAGAPSAVVRF